MASMPQAKSWCYRSIQALDQDRDGAIPLLRATPGLLPFIEQGVSR